MQKQIKNALNEVVGAGNWQIIGKGSLNQKTTIQWYVQLAECAEGTEEKREAMNEAFRLACQSATVAPLQAIRARKAMHRADNRETYRQHFATIRANGE